MLSMLSNVERLKSQSMMKTNDLSGEERKWYCRIAVGDGQSMAMVLLLMVVVMVVGVGGNGDGGGGGGMGTRVTWEAE
ncbi:hypothetical protein M0804_002413 [Polistes exclamans]|nr:hypothetical protein M0804_002413 [Polistes exclamans]